MAKATKEDLDQKMLEFMALLDKDYGKGTTISAEEKETYTDVIPSTSYSFNHASGINGVAKGKVTMVSGFRSSGKAQPLYSKILTPTGWISMKEVEVGTIISTPDGKDSTVIQVHPQGKQDVYKITFDDKTHTLCTLDHLWFTNTRNTELGEVLSTRQIMEKGTKTADNQRKYYIPLIKPLEFIQYGEITINPYLLGLLLGDGGLTNNSVKITNCEEDIINSIKYILETEYNNMMLSDKFGIGTYNFRKKTNGKETNDVYIQIKHLNLLESFSYEKHIPKEYFYTSIENRIALLQGLIDSDGSVDNNSISYSTTSLQLSKDFVELVRSLGGRAVTSSRITKYNSASGEKIDGRVSYRTNVLFSNDIFKPFRSKKHNKNSKNFGISTYSKRFIESIEYYSNEDCKCITIGHPDQLYITDDYIVTHNSTISYDIIGNCQKVFDEPCFLLDREDAYGRAYGERLGIDNNRLKIATPKTLEEMYSILIKVINTNMFGVVVIDSVTAFVPKAKLEGSEKMLQEATIHSRMMPQVIAALKDKKTAVIGLFQLRQAPGTYGDPNFEPGGTAWPFYSHVMIRVTRSEIEKELKQNTMKFTFLKNKLFSEPFRVGAITYSWTGGFDNESEMAELAIDAGIIKVTGRTYTFPELPDFKVTSKAKAIEHLKNNPEYLQNVITPLVKEYLENTHDTSSEG